MSGVVVEVTPRQIAKYLYDVEHMRCNCDLDNWEPTKLTGHSHVCRIHKSASAQKYDMRPGLLDDVRASLVSTNGEQP